MSDGTPFLILLILALFVAVYQLYRRLQRVEADLDWLRHSLRARQAVTEAAPEEAKPVSPPPDPTPVTAAISPSPPPVPSPDHDDSAASGALADDLALLREPVTRPPNVQPQEFERTLTTRWLVWLGAITLAIGGLFLARFAVENGILGPGPRMLLSGLFGLLLVGGGELLARRGWQHPVGFIKADQVPVSLVAAGLSVLFAATYASHALHGLIGPGAAFALLAAISLFGFPLSLRYGPFVGLLTYAGGLLLPLLLRVGEPPRLGDAVWLALLLTALFGVVVRLRCAWLLSVGVLFHGLVTLFLCAQLTPYPNSSIDALVVLLLSLLPLIGLVILTRFPWSAERRWNPPCLLAGVLGAAHLALMSVNHEYGGATWMGMLLLPTLLAWLGMGAGYRRALWPLAATILVPLGSAAIIPYFGGTGDPLMLLVTVLVFMMVSVAGVLRSDRPPLPALCGVAVAVFVALIPMLFLLAPARAALGLPWMVPALSVLGLILALPTVRDGLAARWARQPESAAADALTYYGALSLPLLAITASHWLQDAMFTLVLSLLVLVGVFLCRVLRAHAFLQAACLLASVVGVRFLMNPYVSGHMLVGPLHWPLWSMGGAALVLYLASRIAEAPGAPGGQQSKALADGLLILSLTLGVAAITLELRIWSEGSLRGGHGGLLEVSLRSVAWMASGFAALMPGRRLWVRVFGAILSALALAQVIGMHLLLLNPLWVDEPVGAWPVLNLLTLAYLLPALLLLYARRPLLSRLPINGRNFEGLILLLLLLYAGLSVRQAFHGTFISIDRMGLPADWELYCYSGLGLLVASLLILLGIRTGRAEVRNVAMVVLLVTVAKVFILDMSDLSGVPRILSFIGLGLSLIGVGWVYQRFVFTKN